MIRERDVEQALIKAVEKEGGLCLKFISPGWSGVPDRLILLPGGRTVFAEVKRPGGVLRPLQKRRKEQLEELGFQVLVIDSIEKAKSGGGVLAGS